MSVCGHSEVRFVPAAGVPFRMGREVCEACGAHRDVEGDHVGPWVDAATSPGIQHRPAANSEPGGKPGTG